jgi:hypothetical protein
MSASTAQAKQPPPAQSEPPPAPDPVVAMWQDLRAEDVVTRAGCALSPQDEQRLDAVIADAAGVWRAQFDGDPFWRHIAVVFAVAFSLALATVSAIVVVAWNRSAWWMLLVPAAHAVGWIVGNQLLAVYARIRYGAWSLSDFGEGDTAAVYTTAKWVGISTGLAAALYVVLAPYPGSPEGFFVAAMLVPVTIVLAFPIGLPLKVAFDSVRRLLRPANDPFPLFVCTLVQTLWTLRPSVRDTAPDAHPLPPPGLRSAGALSLDQAATRIELDLERSIPHGGPLAQVLARVGLPAPDDIGRLARQGVADRGRRIAAWLRDRETELLMPAPRRSRDRGGEDRARPRRRLSRRPCDVRGRRRRVAHALGPAPPAAAGGRRRRARARSVAGAGPPRRGGDGPAGRAGAERGERARDAGHRVGVGGQGHAGGGPAACLMTMNLRLRGAAVAIRRPGGALPPCCRVGRGDHERQPAAARSDERGRCA